MDTQVKDTEDRDQQFIVLLSRCALRDQIALRHLYDQVSSKLYSVALRLTGSRDIAEDVLQISFNQIWTDAKSYRPDIAKPMTWMTSIVRHRALDRIRVEQRRHRVIDETIELESEGLASRDQGPMEHFFLQKSLNSLNVCLQRLSESQQRAIMLAYYYGYSREEVANKLNAATGTVKSWLHRGLQRLEECLTTP